MPPQQQPPPRTFLPPEPPEFDPRVPPPQTLPVQEPPPMHFNQPPERLFEYIKTVCFLKIKFEIKSFTVFFVNNTYCVVAFVCSNTF